MRWITQLFKDKEADVPSPSTGFHELDAQPVPVRLQGGDLRAARELVNNTAVQTALAYGIPARWLSFEVVTIADDEKAYFQLQVLMNHWDEHLAAHSFAFERAVIKRIRELDISVGRAVRAVLWRVAPDAGCPYDDMPEPSAWGADAVRKRGDARDLVNRALYAATTPASGAIAPILPALMPVSADEAERAGRSTMPAPHEHLLDDSFGDTRPSSFNGFEPTQPYTAEVVKPTR
jgi:hypothetical protein